MPLLGAPLCGLSSAQLIISGTLVSDPLDRTGDVQPLACEVHGGSAYCEDDASVGETATDRAIRQKRER